MNDIAEAVAVEQDASRRDAGDEAATNPEALGTAAEAVSLPSATIPR